MLVALVRQLLLGGSEFRKCGANNRHLFGACAQQVHRLGTFAVVKMAANLLMRGQKKSCLFGDVLRSGLLGWIVLDQFLQLGERARHKAASVLQRPGKRRITVYGRPRQLVWIRRHISGRARSGRNSGCGDLA